ncbi:MAG TPA: tRNA (N6-threonylcarbamoyladenosine(37)-N6)-methyltransferase TrmO [Pyrinomonadaceae bacterium]|jgi:tRNA-Thr(GGU) m(6)t(6)A37 methyltransferase TsaA
MNIQEIGTIKSPVVEERDEGWGNVIAEIHLNPTYVSGLRGIEAFSHLVIIFFMHQSSFDPATDLVRRPRGRLDMPLVGIFAQRAKHRPAPIGITTVELIGIKGNVLRVKGLDAIDGTPVLDIKPYFKAFDHIEDAVMPAWTVELMRGYF